MNSKGLIRANWSVPENIHAVVTTKQSAPIQNLTEIQDKHVQSLQQVHGVEVFKLEKIVEGLIPKADAIYTQICNVVCEIHTADCLPVFFSDQDGQEIALAHAGWRGLAAGVLENTLECFEAEPDQIVAWFGPAIGPCHFEIGEEVRDLFLQKSDASSLTSVASAFLAGEKPGKWMADLYKLAQIRLNAAGVSKISGGDLCTYCDTDRFYSYRRDKNTGRLSSLIWLN